ncbi:MAG: CotH kinase family protein [Paludibacteraceae bacterium]|nr:CotH kinase family protein [Paludibacteraceae bacterium]
MRRFILTTVCFLFASATLLALTIPQGTLYFDNSKTGYSAVQFVYGSDLKNETYVLTMTQDGNKWRVEIPQTVKEMYRFTFIDGSIRQGSYTQTFSTFKDSISLQLGLNRTATSEQQMNAGEIFVPSSGDNWAQGQWMSLAIWQTSQGGSGAAEISGTLPVIYVNTQNKQPVTDTETQIPATVYIDSVIAKYPSLGSASSPLPATIKGRGNYTWSGFDKKPYKLKFEVKQKVLGMPNNRHWCLMANTDDNLGYLRMPAGFRISKALGLRWTPRVRAVELVLNGKYMGLYFLTEHVRIASNRVKIIEQADKETHRDSITGGWLVEIDNYSSENNITFHEGNGQHVMVSLREPEELSSTQRNYLENQIYAINDALYGASESRVEQLVDIQEAAKYYLVQEIMEDCESYHGSCFLYKDRDSLGIADKWKFGPVWDFGNAYHRHQETWIYINPIWPQYWIGQLATWPAFQQAVKEQWWIYYHTLNDSVRAKIQDLAVSITPAAKNDAVVWRDSQGFNDNSDMSSRLSAFLWYYDWRINWLYSQWGEGIKPAGWGIEEINAPQSPTSKKIIRNGQLFIERGGRIYTLQGLLVE